MTDLVSDLLGRILEAANIVAIMLIIHPWLRDSVAAGSKDKRRNDDG
jgi:hypothetical protein